MRQFVLIKILLFILVFQSNVLAQTPSLDEAISLVITQKKASDLKNALPFTIAPGSKPKFYPGHYTSIYNRECIVVCSLLQGRDITQIVLLLFKNKDGFWINGCWYYDNIYTERFLRTPQENPTGYDENSPVFFTKKIKGNYLLIHGSADDNVHLQNSMEMTKELVKNNIPFDQFIYPNKNHGIYGGNTRLHLYTKMLKFVKDNL
jgi:hypothetical protein